MATSISYTSPSRVFVMKRNRPFPNSLVTLSAVLIVVGLMVLQPFKQIPPIASTSLIVSGHGDELDVKLDGTWAFAIGDRPEWSSLSYDDRTWESIQVPGSWESQGFEGYNGRAWYRKRLALPDYLQGQNISLHLGKIDDVDEVFVNGELVGSTGQFPPNYRTAYGEERVYKIPSTLTRAGELLIAVRVFDSESDGGILHGPIGLRINASQMVDIPLDGVWRFSVDSDNKKRKYPSGEFNWVNMKVPGKWEEQGFRGYNGMAWYQRNVEVPGYLADQEMVLFLGKIDDIDRAWINGVKVGQTGSVQAWAGNINGQEWQQIRAYAIPEGVLRPGQNEITIQVYDATGDGGIFEGPVGLIRQSGLTRMLKKGGYKVELQDYDPDRYKEY